MNERRSYFIGNAPTPVVGQRVRVPVKGKIMWATVTAVRDGRIEVTAISELKHVNSDMRISRERTGECPCGGTWGVCTYHGGPAT